MKGFFQRNHRFLFYSSWVALGLIQSRFTELMDDEAYYWVYSKFLDWGYFDHPPLTALLIRVGYSLIQNELGVRLLFLFLNIMSLLIIEKIIDKRNPFIFYAIVLSLGAIQLTGFSAVPDTPLIFFTAFFFLCYKNFLQRSSLSNSLLLGITAAALLYSKYHGVLVLFFVLLSNIKLLARYQTYIAGLIAFSLFMPHLWWQYNHEWLSFRYHLFESNVNPYRLSFTLEYLGGQVLLAGPIAGILLLPAAFFYRTKNSVEKSLRFTLAGIYIFFLMSSLRGKVEANWTSPAIVPLIVLSHNFLRDNHTVSRQLRKWLLRLLPLTMIIVLAARIVMIEDILPNKDFKKRYHGWKNWPLKMKQVTGGLPVVFENSYQRASKYWFYTGQLSYSLNHYRERRNNYNFWPIEDSILGKPVYILDVHNPDSFMLRIPTALGILNYKYDSMFASFAKVRFIPDRKTVYMERGAHSADIDITADLPEMYLRYIATHPLLRTDIVVGVFDKYGWLQDLPIAHTLHEMVSQRNTIHLELNLKPGTYYLIFSILNIGTVTATHNSDKIKMIVR